MQIGRWAAAAVVVVGTWAVASQAWAQTSEQISAQAGQASALTGVVLDSVGAVVPGAEVTVRSGQVIVYQAKTNLEGRFNFAGPSQDYEVNVRHAGFRTIHEATIPFTQGSLTHFTLQAFAGSVTSETSTPSAPALSPVRDLADRRPLEYGVFFQGGVGVTENRSNFRFLLAGAHLGKVLTPQLGSGLLQGNFEYAGELIPYWQSFTPTFQRIKCPSTTTTPVNPNTCSGPYTVGGTFTGVSVTPIILRWNFTHGQRWMPWVQGAGGLLWTNHKYPAYGDTNPQDINEVGPNADTSVFNFTPQFGIGTHIFIKPRRSLDFSANAVHISSASLGDRNPGVNASVQLAVGYSWWK